MLQQLSTLELNTKRKMFKKPFYAKVGVKNSQNHHKSDIKKNEATRELSIHANIILYANYTWNKDTLYSFSLAY